MSCCYSMPPLSDDVVMRSPYIECNGYRSCWIALGEEVHCNGAESCKLGILSSIDEMMLDMVVVSGYRAVYFGLINAASYVELTGTEAAVNTTISSNGIPEMMVIVSGQKATLGARCNCYGKYLIHTS